MIHLLLFQKLKIAKQSQINQLNLSRWNLKLQNIFLLSLNCDIDSHASSAHLETNFIFLFLLSQLLSEQ